MSGRARQTSFFSRARDVHGGVSVSGHPREARPLSTKRPIHLVLKSSRATGERSFLRRKNAAGLKAIVERHAKRNGVKIYRFANAGNHLHFVVKISNRALFKTFLRSISGLIARLVLGAEKGAAKLGLQRSTGAKAKFWDARPFTRVATWGKAFDVLCSYLALNNWEALGFIKHSRRDGQRKLWIVKYEPDPPSAARKTRY